MEITINMKIENEELKDLLGLQKEKPNKGCESYRNPHVRIFDESSLAWTRDSESNRYFLLQQQDYANMKLRQRGHLFLNEIYDMLGLSRTRDGQLEGWVYDTQNPFRNNFVDFGLFEHPNRDFVNGLKKSVVLKFNVDGNILDQLWEEP